MARCPSVNRTVNSARSASVVTIASFGSIVTISRTPLPISAPASRNRSAVDKIVRAATPDSETLISSTSPKRSTRINIME